MNDKASLTALMSAFGRVYHARNEPNPIFNDACAGKLMLDEEYEMIGRYILSGMDFFAPDQKGRFENDEDALRYLVYTQIAPTPLARARFCEDCLKAAAQSGDIQYVILGAGMDSFAFREVEFMKAHRVFELDHPLTQADKLERIARARLEIPNTLHFVAMDFSKDDLKERLLGSGFDPNQRAFFSWLGVTYYLSESEIELTLDALASLAASGSRLVFDYADEDLFASQTRRVRNMIAMAAAGGEKMQSCFEREKLDSLLKKHGFSILEQLSPRDIQEKYFSGRGRELTAFEHIHYLQAIFESQQEEKA